MVQSAYSSVEIGKFLRNLRTSAKPKLSQKDAAKAVGCSVPLVSRFEKGERSPSPAQLATFARIYGVDRRFVLLRAGVLELPGFEAMMERIESRQALDRAVELAAQPGEFRNLLLQATDEELRQIARFLAWLRFPLPVV